MIDSWYVFFTFDKTILVAFGEWSFYPKYNSPEQNGYSSKSRRE